MQDLTTFRLIERISTLLRSEQRKKYVAIGLQPIHVQVLEFLSQCNAHTDTPAMVADYLGLTKGTVSQSLQVLERKGYIAKYADADDGRVVHLKLQTAGVELVEKIRPLELFAQAEQAVTQQNFSSLEAALQATLAALQTANHSKSFGLCHTCLHFSEVNNYYHCQLTDLPLMQADANKICREHTLTAAG
jgi:DNA-binding MarR family transcriptional regulator